MIESTNQIVVDSSVIEDAEEIRPKPIPSTNVVEEETSEKSALEAENKLLKKELQFVKNRFDQVLEDRNEVIKDMEDTKRKYEEELSAVREDFRKEKAEREHLRVRNSLLQDMSQIIVEKCLKPKRTSTTIEEDTDDIDEVDIVRNKNRGYRRVSPTETSEKEKEPVKTNERSCNMNNERARDSSDDKYKPKERVQYCHFFNNAGRCIFEERFGRQCRFAHQPAPICHYDRQCDRPKCMFRHTQQAGDFLEPRFPSGWNPTMRQRQPVFQNPWGPWGNSNQHQ